MRNLDTVLRTTPVRVGRYLALLLSVVLLSVTSSRAQQPFEVYPSSLHTDAIVGSYADYYVTILNYLDDPVTLSVTITGADAAAYSAESSITVDGYEQGDSTGYGNLKIRFTPTQVGAHSAIVTVSDGQYNKQIKLEGQGKVPQPYISGPQQFSAFVGDMDCNTMTVVNQTAIEMTLTSIQMDKGAPYSVSNLPTLPYILAPGTQVQFDVCFSPTVPGYTYDSVSVNYEGGGMTGSVTHGMFGSGVAQQFTCFSLSGDSSFGYVDVDETVTNDYTVTNTSGRTILVTASLSSDPHFKLITPPLPYSLGPSESMEFSIRLYSGNDNMKQGFYGNLRITGTDSAKNECNEWLNVYAIGAYTSQPVDTTGYSLTGDKKEKLDVDGEAGDSYRIFRFVNQSGDSLKIISVEMKKGDDFSARVLFNPPQEQLPMMMYQGDVMLVRIDLTNEEPGDYKDDLIITTETSIMSYEFGVEGTVAPASVSRAANSVAKLTIGENPSRGPVTISVENARQSTITILDLTGRTVTETTEATLRWNATAAQASQVYLVRATGVDEHGQPFIVTDRLIIVK